MSSFLNTLETEMASKATDAIEDVDTDSESDDEQNVATRVPVLSEKRRAQNAKFSAWLSQRAEKITKDEVQAIVENADEETLSIRSLMARQESNVIITTPREYQLELFERAKKQNIIAVLDTGSGKTLIAVLLLKHVLDQELEHRAMHRKPRISFFLVDCVTLVFQQFAVLERNLDQKVERFCGEMGCDLYVKTEWRKHFAENMVIVCTAEILNQCLMHSFISMDEINLLVFDEAHHTKRNHPYARIIKDYYIPGNDPAKLPKIFGMTASPVDARVDVIKAAKELEAMLHCQIATTSDLSLLRNSISRPDEHIAVYDRLEYAYETPLCSKLKAKFGDLSALSKNFRNAREAASHLGQWCADSLWRFALEEEASTAKAERKMERIFLSGREDRPTELLDKQLVHLSEARDIVRKWVYPPPSLEGNNLSPKVLLLHKYLSQIFERPTDAKCIIFVKQRYTARVLGQVLRKVGTPHMHLDLLMGNRPGEVGDVKFSFRQQVMTLLKFRKGDLNCLVATSIAEEGLDIPDCNLVIRFDLYDTLIQYIQSRGRARHGNSKYIHMVEKGNKMHYQSVKDVCLGEQVMRQFCEALPADRLLQGENCDLETALMKEKLYRKYVDPESGATLTYANSLVVLAHLVGCLPHKNETIQQATYILSTEGNQFVCEVILPEKSPLHSATGKPCPRKSLAKRSAAFEACIQLREKNFLDSNLIPIYQKYLPQMRNAHLALQSKKTNAYKRRIKPDLWEQHRGSTPAQLYVTLLELETPESLERDYQPIAILTRTRLPDFPSFLLHVQPKKSSNVICRSISEAVDMNASKLNELTTFTESIYRDVFAKTFEMTESRMDYWLAPIFTDWKARTSLQTPERLIDWALIGFVCSNPTIRWSPDTPEDQIINRYIVDTWTGARRYYTLAIEPRLKPTDPIPASEASDKSATSDKDMKKKDILAYSASKGNKNHKLTAIWDEQQPVIRAEQVAHRLNFLDEHGEQEKATGNRRYICLEPFKISALPISVVSMCYLFPCIMHRLEAYLIAKDAFDLLGLDVRLDLALEAVTKDSDNTEEHRAEQIQLQRGMGRNYERLEFLGDCFLKLATSITLFCNSPEDNEFEYHVRRMLMICNSNLLKSALNIKLFEYVRSRAFERREWYPQGIKLLKGRGATKGEKTEPDHRLGDKTVADVCEAMIGATLLSFHDTGDKDVAIKAVTALVSNDDHDVTKWADYYGLYEKPKYQTAQATASQLDLAQQIEKKDNYHFIYPRLLRSAFIHPSCTFITERIPCYQRLEFLGDALLDLACVNYLFHRYPDKDPQWLTEHKMAMVSNKFLAALSVRLGFHKHLRSSGAVIEYQNREYVGEIEEAEKDAKGARDYWTNTKQPPKALSDIVEAYIGAVFVDSKFDFGEVERFFDEHIRWFFEDMTIYDTFANNHPTTYLHNLMTLSFGCTNYRLMASEIPSIVPGDPPTSIAALMVHNEIVAEGQASSSKNAKVKASSNALKKLSGLAPFEYRAQYHCDCDGQTKEWVGKDGGGTGMIGTAI